MRARRFVIGLALTGLMLGGLALPAQARTVVGVKVPPVPTAAQLQALATSLVPATPTIVRPELDLQNPELPNLPYVAIPIGLSPALGVLSPASVVTCQVSYLGPLVGIVAMTAAFDAAGIDPPVKPGFLGPAWGPVTTACVLAPFPGYSACGPDGNISKQLASLPELPGAGPVPVPDPFSLLPAPFASLVVVLAAIEHAVNEYVYHDTPQTRPASVNFTKKLAKQLTCTNA